MNLILILLCYYFTAGITLSLFGGVRKHSMDQNKVPVRGDIHVIIVGMLTLKFRKNNIFLLKFNNEAIGPINTWLF